MNYGQLKQTVLDRLSMDGSDPAASVVGGLVNEGLHLVEVSAPNGWSWLRQLVDFSTTANTRSYTFATIDGTYEIAKVLDAKVLQGVIYYPLTVVSAHEADATYASTATSIPSEIVVEGSTVYLIPTPNDTYTVRVRVVVTENDLSNDTDEPIIPARYHGAIVTAACLIYYQLLQDTVRTTLFRTMLDDWIKRMSASGGEYGGPVRVGVRNWLRV